MLIVWMERLEQVSCEMVKSSPLVEMAASGRLRRTWERRLLKADYLLLDDSFYFDVWASHMII